MIDTAPSDVQAAADAAFEYGYPLTEMMRVCDTLANVNQIYSRTTLATPADTKFVLPNNDTLYSEACVYLEAGWVELTLPARAERYMSVEIFDAYTNNVALASARDIPTQGQTYFLRLTGASSAGIPKGAQVFDVPTPFAYVLIRTLVDGPPDLAAANAVQNGIRLRAQTPSSPERPFVTAGTAAQNFFRALMHRLAQNPPPQSERELIASFEIAGIRASRAAELLHVSASQLAAWETAHANGFKRLESKAFALNPPRGSWFFPNPEIATPGRDYTLRAVIARLGIFPLPPTESIYPRTMNDGTTPRVLHLPSTWPPIDAGGFWSLTLYTNGFLVDNPIDRYSIGDRTPGLKREPDGSVKIYIQSSDPGGDRTANWLPAPHGQYSVTMRLYLPNASTREPSFTLPAIA